MPELPEVETVVQKLRLVLPGNTLSDFHLVWPKVLSNIESNQFSSSIAGQLIRSVERRGKYIIIRLTRGLIAVHLRMTGRLYAVRQPIDLDHRHVTGWFQCENGIRLVLQDMRKFGRISFHQDLQWLEEKLGPEPLGEQFTAQWLSARLSCSGRQMKALLLDQGFIAGLGNIYTDESLWHARIHPKTAGKDVTLQKAERLHDGIRRILRQAIDSGGTTFLNYESEPGVSGSYRNRLQVFNRSGKSCPRCGTGIIKTRVSNRGTYLCPSCQGEPV